MEAKTELIETEVIESHYKTLSEYRTLLNTQPRNEWIKTNQYSGGAKYLPIRIVEQLLNKMFPFWQVEQHGEPKIIGNSIIVSVHLKVYNPLLKEWLSYAGIGAVPIEVKKGHSPIDFENINAKAMHKNVPAAMSFALSNASKKIGRLFGSHLNNDINEII